MVTLCVLLRKIVFFSLLTWNLLKPHVQCLTTIISSACYHFIDYQIYSCAQSNVQCIEINTMEFSSEWFKHRILHINATVTLTGKIILIVFLFFEVCSPLWSSLRKHVYANMQKISPPKNRKISDKKLWYFSYFCSKHRLWVLVRTASEAVLTSTHNLCFEQKYEK